MCGPSEGWGRRMLMNTGRRRRRRRRRRNNNRQHKQPTADENPTTPAGIHGERDRLGIQWVNVMAAVFLVLGCSTKKIEASLMLFSHEEENVDGDI